MGEVPDGLNCEGAVFPVPDLCKAEGEFCLFAGEDQVGEERNTRLSERVQEVKREEQKVLWKISAG